MAVSGAMWPGEQFREYPGTHGCLSCHGRVFSCSPVPYLLPAKNTLRLQRGRAERKAQPTLLAIGLKRRVRGRTRAETNDGWRYQPRVK